MKKYDVVVIGSGCGMTIVDEALHLGLSVALVDRGPLGGTCANTGCIPSKMLIFAADRVTEIEEAGRLGIEAEIRNVEFGSIMERMRRSVHEGQQQMRSGIAEMKNLDHYDGTGRFVADYTMEINDQTIKADRVFIAAGSRPFIPPIKGLEDADYLTNEGLLQLKEKPNSMIIIGGGYVAVEFGHFLAAMGVEVTILEMASRLVLSEEPEIADVLKKELSHRMGVHTGVRAQEITRDASGATVTVDDVRTGMKKDFSAERILVAVGRRSNADLLNAAGTGVEVDQKGFIKVDEYFETTRKGIFAVGDINGQQMFTHVANEEASLAAYNGLHGSEKIEMDYSAAPHAVYSHPQIASVGLTEEAARRTHKVLVGRARYADVAQGEAMMDRTGFGKAIVEAGSRRILGFHIIGPYAPVLIQAVTDAMTSGGGMEQIQASMQIHPAITELVPAVFSNLEDAG